MAETRLSPPSSPRFSTSLKFSPRENRQTGPPPSLQQLTIEHCPLAKSHAIKQLLTTISRTGIPLQYLSVHHMPRLNMSSLDQVLGLFPGLQELNVSIDYITPHVLNPEFQEWHIVPPPDFSTHSLRVLTLTNSGDPGVEDKFSPIDIIVALDEGSFPELRHIRIAKSLNWQHGETGDETDALIDKLQELGQQDYDERRGIYAEMTTEEWKQAKVNDWAGVWMIDG